MKARAIERENLNWPLEGFTKRGGAMAEDQ